MGLLIGSLVIYTAHQGKKRVGGCWNKWGPTFLVTTSMFLVLADTIRHVLQDANLWPEDPQHRPGFYASFGFSNQYMCSVANTTCCPEGACCNGMTAAKGFNCTIGCHSDERWSCMGATGMLFTTAFTYVGFGMLAVGSMWSANLCGKLREVKAQWKQLRSPGIN